MLQAGGRHHAADGGPAADARPPGVLTAAGHDQRGRETGEGGGGRRLTTQIKPYFHCHCHYLAYFLCSG